MARLSDERSIKDADSAIAHAHRVVSHFRSCAPSAPFSGRTPAGRKLIAEASRRRPGQPQRRHVTKADAGICFRSRQPAVYCACVEFAGSVQHWVCRRNHYRTHAKRCFYRQTAKKTTNSKAVVSVAVLQTVILTRHWSKSSQVVCRLSHRPRPLLYRPNINQ